MPVKIKGGIVDIKKEIEKRLADGVNDFSLKRLVAFIENLRIESYNLGFAKAEEQQRQIEKLRKKLS